MYRSLLYFACVHVSQSKHEIYKIIKFTNCKCFLYTDASQFVMNVVRLISEVNTQSSAR